MLSIASAQNDTFKKILSLTQSKGLKKEGLFLLSGEDLVREFLKKPALKIHFEVMSPKLKPIARSNEQSFQRLELSQDLFDQIDGIGTHFNLLVLQQPVMEKLDAASLETYKPEGIELVIPTGDPGNLGALLRSAEAFGVKRVILTEEAAHPFLPKAVKASAGSVRRLPLVHGPALSKFPGDCLALAMNGDPIDDFTWPKNALLVVGEEGRGLGQTHFKQRLSIPTEGVESLNAVVAASIALAFHKLVP